MRQLIAPAGDHDKIFIAQFAPGKLDRIAYYFPVTSDLIPIHARDSFTRDFPFGLSLEPFQARITPDVNSTPLMRQTSDGFPDIS